MFQLLLVNLPRSLKTVFTTMLEPLDCQLTACETATEALELLKKNAFRIVITTYELKDIKGDQFCILVREQFSETLPVFLITSNEELLEPESLAQLPFTEVYLSEQLPLMEQHLHKILSDLRRETSQSGHILVVEDNVAQQKVFEALLTDQGYEVSLAKSYDQACTLLADHEFDLVILDIILEGGISGISFVHHVRHLESNKQHTPVLVTSAYQATSRTIEIYRMGANDFLPKPFTEEVMLARVTNLVKFKHAQDKIHEQEKVLQFLAMHDGLTGLHNRRYFIETCTARLAEAARQDYPLSLLMIDVDHFKRVNDEHGHGVGDEVLVAIAQLLHSSCRSSDVSARLGGEEFTVLFGFCDQHDAIEKAEALRKAVEQHPFTCGTVTVSIGISTRDNQHPMADFNTLYNEADSALYAAKADGRNRVRHNQHNA